MTFDDLIELCEKRGEPFQTICKRMDGSYQASLRSKFNNKSFACDIGATPTQALRAVMTQRGMFNAPNLAADDLI